VYIRSKGKKKLAVLPPLEPKRQRNGGTELEFGLLNSWPESDVVVAAAAAAPGSALMACLFIFFTC